MYEVSIWEFKMLLVCNRNEGRRKDFYWLTRKCLSLFLFALTRLYSQKLWRFSFFLALNRRLQILYTNEDSKAFLVDPFLT